ncbi:MAG TPA: DJ-1 family glyoxalase III [archaeon]|nr:DJ-1 family glyoxalase III [archaeon]
MPKALVFLADGFEDIEGVAVIDVLRRAGINVKTVGLVGNIVTSARGVRVYADERLIDFDKASEFDAIVLPGGAVGTENLGKHEKVLRVIDDFAKSGKLICAICAAPSILAKRGLLKEKRATIFPGMEKLLDKPRDEAVVVDGNIITSQGPGTAIAFGLKIVEMLMGPGISSRLKQDLVA